MSKTPKEETSPATKADIAAILARFDAVDQRFDGVDKRLDGVHKRLDAVDRRFATMEKQLDDRFDAVDRRFDAVDQQFGKVLECIGAEGKESRLHAANLAEEMRRHLDAKDENLRSYVKGMFDQKTFVYGEKFRDHERRIRALERGETPATVS